MKVTKALLYVAFSVNAVSAFGLHNVAANAVKSMGKAAPFNNKRAMVQPVDIYGNRLSSIVSQTQTGTRGVCVSRLTIEE
jgi:hypothetical protein